MSALLNKHGPGTESLVALAPLSRAYGPTRRTLLGVDESVAQPPVADAVQRLVGAGQVFAALPLWYEQRQRDNGEIFTSHGAPGGGVVHGRDWGKRVPGDSWSDDQVVATAVCYLYRYRRVIILTADRRRDHEGLGAILRRDVAPVLNRDRSHGLSLVLLVKHRRATIEAYARRAVKYVCMEPFTPGFVREMI